MPTIAWRLLVLVALVSLSVSGGRTPKQTDPNAPAPAGGCIRTEGPIEAVGAAFLNCKSDGAGGALSLEDPNNESVLTCVIFARNQAKTDGGAIAVTDSELELRNSTLSLNGAGNRGGGISAVGDETERPTVHLTDRRVIGIAKASRARRDLREHSLSVCRRT